MELEQKRHMNIMEYEYMTYEYMIYEHMTYECIVLLCIYMHRESRSDSEVDTIVKLIWPKA